MDLTDLTRSFLAMLVPIEATIYSWWGFLVNSATAAISTENSSIWATLITDIITVAAALGALALPISLNVIETARSRYRSPSLLKITSIISGIDAKSLNKYLFVTLGISLAFKLLVSLRIIQLLTLVPYLIALTGWFGYVTILVYRHLRFTYTFMSDIASVHEQVICNVISYAKYNYLSPSDDPEGNLNTKLRPPQKIHKVNIEDHIAALIEIETYLIISNPAYDNIDDRIRLLLWISIPKISVPAASVLVKHTLLSLPSMMAAIEVSREADIYQIVSSFYLSASMDAILIDESFSFVIGNIERIARFRERDLPPYGQFCKNGRLFSYFSHKTGFSTDAYMYLLAHFKRLIENAAIDQPTNVPIILDNIRQVIQFKDNYHPGAWDIPAKVDELWGCPALPELNKFAEDAFNQEITEEAFNTRLNDEFSPILKAFLNNVVSDEGELADKHASLDVALATCSSQLALQLFSSEIEKYTIRILASLLTKSPEAFIACRELRNPAGSKSFNVGHSPVPTSLPEIINAFINARSYSVSFPFYYELQEYHIVDAIGALVIYELWKIFIVGALANAIKPKLTAPIILSEKLYELKSALARVGTFKTSLLKCLANEKYIDRLGILPSQLEELENLSGDFCDLLTNSINLKIKTQISTQVLDPELIGSFKSEILDQMFTFAKKLPLLKSFTIRPVTPLTINLQIPRESFLSNNDTHYVFDYGRSLIYDIHNCLAAQLLFHNSLADDCYNTLPSHSGILLICSSQSLKKFVIDGFTVSGNTITWPNGAESMEYYEVNCEGNGYFLVMPDDRLISVSYEKSGNNSPIEFDLVDTNGFIEVTIRCYLSAQSTAR